MEEGVELLILLRVGRLLVLLTADGVLKQAVSSLRPATRCHEQLVERRARRDTAQRTSGAPFLRRDGRVDGHDSQGCGTAFAERTPASQPADDRENGPSISSRRAGWWLACAPFLGNRTKKSQTPPRRRFELGGRRSQGQ